MDELDAIAEIPLDKYEADLFMTASRTGVITKRVASKIRARVKSGDISRWKFLSDGLYRETEIDELVEAEVEKLYRYVHRRSAKPKPSPELIKALARAYRKKARGFLSILRLVKMGFGLVFEDEEERRYEYRY